MLQETLTPPIPELEAPPELQRTQAVSLALVHQPIQFLTPPTGKAISGSNVVLPLFSVLVLYSLGVSILLLSAVSSPESIRQELAISSALLTPAVVVHTFACQHSKLGQVLGIALAFLITPVFATTSHAHPAPLTVLAVLFSLFSSRCSRSEDCAGLRIFVVTLGILCATCATAACFTDRHLREYLWAAAAVTALGQAAATSGVLAQFELVCVLKSR
jgi:hypothetical protein